MNIGCICQGTAAPIKANPQFLRQDFHIRFYEQSDVIGLYRMNLHPTLSEFSPAHSGIPSLLFASLRRHGAKERDSTPVCLCGIATGKPHVFSHQFQDPSHSRHFYEKEAGFERDRSGNFCFFEKACAPCVHPGPP